MNRSTDSLCEEYAGKERRHGSAEKMDEDLITKKQLLEITGISYGALYRWKRMNLLPDDWFIRRSTVTGHETYFPRSRILERVAEIQRLKKTMSLEDIVRQFQPAASGTLLLSREQTGALGFAPVPVINQFLAMKEYEVFDFEHLLELYIFSQMITESGMTRDDAFLVAQAVETCGDISEPVIYLLRKYGISFVVTAGAMQKIIFDDEALVQARISVREKTAELSSILREKGITI